MAIKYVILLAVANTAVLATSEHHESAAECINGTEFIAFNREFSNFQTCLRNLLNTDLMDEKAHPLTCNTTPVLEAAAACGKTVNYTDVALNFTMNESRESKDILTPEKVKCVNDSKEELKKCVKHSIPGQEKVADQLGYKDNLAREILNLNFQPSQLKKAEDLQICIRKVLNTKSQCSDLSKFTDQLFDKLIVIMKRNLPVESSTDKSNSASNIPWSIIGWSVFVIASLLLVLSTILYCRRCK